MPHAEHDHPHDHDPDHGHGHGDGHKHGHGHGGHGHTHGFVADGAHARADACVSLAVIASAAVVAAGLPIADPIIGLVITVVILRITLDSWRTVRQAHVA